MRILLDTCTFLWLQLDPRMVPESLRRVLMLPDTRRYFSAAAAWEIAVKWANGKLVLPCPPDEFVRRARAEGMIESVPVSEAAVLLVAKLPKFHNDPFDRIQISQAIDLGLALATPDPVIRQYAVRTIWD